jgi:hypothetical protein
MSDKSTVLRGFNNLLFEFVDDIISIFPDNYDLKDIKTAFEFFKKANPTSIIKAWHYFVYQPYKDVIKAGDLSFFCDKDYKSDLSYMKNSDNIMKAIDKIRDPVKQMNPVNKDTAMKYVKNLCMLSNVYSQL